MDLTFSLVISRFRESLEDVKDLIQKFDSKLYNLKVYIYNKDDRSNINKEDLDFETIIENLPNVGREAHTSLYHLYKHYEELTDVIYFIPASYKTKNHPETCAPGCIFNTLDNFHLLPSHQDNLDLWYNWILDSWGGTHSENSKVATQCNYIKCRNRPFGKWIVENVLSPLNLPYFLNPLKNGLCGFIQTLKERVYNIPKDLLKSWIQELEEDGPNSEVCHYWERTWGTILGSFNSSLPIKNIQKSIPFNKNVIIKSVNYPELDICNFNEDLFKIHNNTCIFKIVESLNSKEKCISILYNNKYLCSDESNLLKLKSLEDTKKFKDSVSFRLYKGLSSNGYSFESYDKPNYFIRHNGYIIYTHLIYNSDLYKLDSSFEIIEFLS
jgi:hypothetical protein